jgi:hypothetical protein
VDLPDRVAAKIGLHLQPSKLICEEKQKLVAVYQEVTEQYSVAVQQLRQQAGTLPKADYDALYQRTEALHEDVDAARLKLQAHVLEHSC